MNERDLIWQSVDGNPLWLRARISRYRNPSGFAMAMIPERNARIGDPEWKQVLDWIKDSGLAIKIMPDGLLAFESEEDLTMFMLRWA